MRLGIIGLPQSGKFTIFKALTGARGINSEEGIKKGDQLIATVNVPDERVDYLTEIIRPKRTIYSRVEYVLPPKMMDSDHAKRGKEDIVFSAVRTCDGLIHVVKNFQLFGGLPATPEEDFFKLESEMILADLMVAEKRIERIKSDEKKGKGVNIEELSLLNRCRDILSEERPLRDNTEIAVSPLLKGFTFLSAKPMLVIANNSDEDEAPPKMPHIPKDIDVMVVRGKLEMEIGEMEPEEAREFLSAFRIERSLIDRVIKRSLAVTNLISFFTVVEDEVRSWTVTKGTSAIEAADLIHSDMKKGFIKAEVLPYDRLVRYGNFSGAKKDGHLHLEGKKYIVQDGDIIRFRFSV
ncbi:MAG: redox-regulated ATPase YchF [Deltaproteobacteria bacterium]|nr:MAG: redox-regulated ATPase YchF [Deltaproteobacteria bacterium]